MSLSLLGLTSPGVQVSLNSGTSVAASATGYFNAASLGGVPKGLLICCDTGGIVLLKPGATSITPGAGSDWYSLAIHDGETRLLPGCETLAVYVPAGEPTLYAGTTSKNFSVHAYY